MISHIESISESIYSPFVPTVIFFVVSFVVGSLFMDVFAVGADTILLCYCLEMDVMRGMSYACPEELKHVMKEYQREG
jgi:choline transporter-like protein 2/4/5